MVILGIFLLLLLAALAIVIFQVYNPSVARSWMIALISSLLAWGILFVMRLFLPTNFQLLEWLPNDLFMGTLTLNLDYQNWPYALALLTLCLAVVLTDSTRSSAENSPLTWAGTLSVTAINLLALLAGNPLTLVLAWTLGDLVELVYLLRIRHWEKPNQGITLVFAARLLSIFSLIAATIVGWQVNPGFLLTGIPAVAGIYFLIAAGLRLGVFPFEMPYLDAPELKHGAGLLVRLTPVASALVLIAHLPSDFLVLQQWPLGIIQGITLIAALYSSAMWLFSPDVNSGRRHWVIALSAFALQCALNGNAAASLPWGLALLLTGGMVFLFDPPIRRIRFIPLLGLLGLIALPYTPAASGWAGILGEKFTVASAVMILSHALLLLGYLRYVVESNTTITGLDNYARLTYPLGLIIILQTSLILGLVGWPGVLTVGTWYGGAASLALVFIGIFISRWFGLRMSIANLATRLPFYRFFAMLLGTLRSIFSFGWLFQLGQWAFRQVSSAQAIITRVIEGEGGILWSLTFLVGLIILFFTRVNLP